MKETLIIAGANINKEFVEKYIKENSSKHIIAVDKGLECLDSLNIIPTHIIGDFDSVDKDILEKYRDKEIEINTFNSEKDYTDTDLAIQLAIQLGNNNITIIGGIGIRLDHTIANIHILNRALEKDIKCRLIDEHNEIFLINEDTELILDKNYSYISLIPLTNIVKIKNLEGFKYKLNNQILKIGESIGISNEQIQKRALIKISEGLLIVIKSKD